MTMATAKQLFLVGLTYAVAQARESVKFQDDFSFGAATSSYQIEGGWNEDGKGWSMWDHLVRTDPDFIFDGTNGDIASNSYHLYKRDVEMLKELGVSVYRFSISWPRILPNGRPDYVNPLGVEYYNNLINELLKNGITPFVTMYHWDLPQNLNEQGGLLSDKFQDWFGDYARVLYQNFGDRVKHWLTINEPFIHCHFAYGTGLHAPRIQSPGTAFYDCGRNILLANARSYHIYNDEGFRASQGGQVGIVLSMNWAYPATDSEDDADAVHDLLAFEFDQYMNPIFSPEGNYPQRVIDRAAAASANQGLTESRLKPFTQEHVDYIRGTSDFLALNHYTTDIVYRNSSVNFVAPSWMDDANYATSKDPSWPTSGSIWLREHAPGLYHSLVYIKDRYNSPTVYITENGFSTAPTSSLVDDGRVQYFRNYLTAVHQAVSEGVDVRGYFAWSLMDNFEWSAGYSQRFGLYEVDITNPDRPRTPRKSALVYREIIRSRVIDFEYDPDPYEELGVGYSTMAAVMSITMVLLFQLAKAKKNVVR